jgi:hypothetical protein
MPSRFLHRVVSLILVLIAALDFAVPCCSAENSFPVATRATITSGLPQVELITIAAEKTPVTRDGRCACDSCYCCSTFTNTASPLGSHTLTAAPCALSLRAQVPPSTSLQSLYRPPRA